MPHGLQSACFQSMEGIGLRLSDLFVALRLAQLVARLVGCVLGELPETRVRVPEESQ